MTRPCCMRHVSCRLSAVFFKPAGIPVHELEIVTLALDEVEALRLADLEGLYQEQAAEQMKISRATFARIVEQARRKTADALIHGKALRIENGPVAPGDPQQGTSARPGPGGRPRPRHGRNRPARTK